VRLDTVRIHDYRTVWGDAVELRLGRAVTALVGPNLSGKSNLARALAAAVDDRIVFDIDRDRPSHLPDAVPTVELGYRDLVRGKRDHLDVEVSWPLGTRVEQVHPGHRLDEVPTGCAVVCWAGDRPADVLARVADVLATEEPAALAADLLPTLQRILPEVDSLDLPDGPGGQVVVRDQLGFEVADHTLRATMAAAVAAHLVRTGVDLSVVVVEEPEVFLHPAAQETLRDELLEVGVAADAPVLLTTESPFLVPRDPEAMVIAVARGPDGRTRVVETAAGDAPQAPLLGGLFRDAGLAGVFDRAGGITNDTVGLLVVEGGTDKAYLEETARVLGREDDLEHIRIHPAGGALPAALMAILLRAETDLPILVLLDNDDNGRRARDTLVRRFGFAKRKEVMTYAEVFDSYPMGVDAEDMFDRALLDRFVSSQGPRARRTWTSGDQVALTPAAKSAFVGWLADNLDAESCGHWGTILDRVVARLHGHEDPA
jgi:5S rRNA maturation endonuclease (ribonuclease M5)